MACMGKMDKVQAPHERMGPEFQAKKLKIISDLPNNADIVLSPAQNLQVGLITIQYYLAAKWRPQFREDCWCGLNCLQAEQTIAIGKRKFLTNSVL